MANLVILTPKQQEVWTKVEEYKQKHNSTAAAALDTLGFHASTYNAAKKRLGVKRTYNRKTPALMTLEVPEIRPSRVVAFVGDPQSVVLSVNEFMRGN